MSCAGQAALLVMMVKGFHTSGCPIPNLNPSSRRVRRAGKAAMLRTRTRWGATTMRTTTSGACRRKSTSYPLT